MPALHVMVQGENKLRLLSPTFGDAMPLKENWRVILNPGSVGQPRDNDRRAAYAVLDTDAAVLGSRAGWIT